MEVSSEFRQDDLPAPVAPESAARDPGGDVQLAVLVSAFERLHPLADMVLVEGVGGWAALSGTGTGLGDLVTFFFLADLFFSPITIIGTQLSEATLAIVTAATLRLLPAPTGRVTACAGLASITAARSLLRRVERDMGEALEGFEVMPAHCLESVLAHLPAARAPLDTAHPWNALIECVSASTDSAGLRDRLEASLAAALEEGLLGDAVIAANERQADDFWTLRDSISAAERAIGPAMQHDISVPVEKMPEFILAASPAIEADCATMPSIPQEIALRVRNWRASASMACAADWACRIVSSCIKAVAPAK